MSAPERRPPEGTTARTISSAARRVERLKLRRRPLLRKLQQLGDKIRQAGRLLRDVVRDATAPTVGEQLTVADMDAADPLAPLCVVCDLGEAPHADADHAFVPPGRAGHP